MNAIKTTNMKYRIKGDVEAALKVLRTSCISEAKSDDSDLTGLYKKIIHELDSSKTDNDKIKYIKRILASSEEFKSVNKKFCRKYVFSYGLSKKRYTEILDKSKEFFNFLSSIPKSELEKVKNSGIYLTSLFLTYVGVKPSSLLSKELASVLKNSPDTPFKDYQQIDSKFNENQTLFYNPQKLLKVVQQNRDVFGYIKNESELKDDLTNNQICISYREKTNTGEKYYYDQMRTGVVLGIPKSEVIKFASYEKLIYQYEEYLYKNNWSYDDFEDEYFDNEKDPKNMKEFNNYKAKNVHKLNLYTPQSETKDEIIDLLAGRVLIDFSYQYYQSDVKFYTYGFDRFINRNYASSIRKILNDTQYFENLKNLGV